MKNKYGVTNLITATIIFVLWALVFLGRGMIKSVSWSALTMFLPLISFVWIVLSVFMMASAIIKKKSLVKAVLTFVISMAMAFPIVFMVDIIPFAYPNNINKVKPSITVGFPLKEQTVIGWGGNDIRGNKPHAKLPSERWAYDLVMAPYNHGATRNEEYGIWDKEVIAPANGVVVAAFDKEEDILPLNEAFKSSTGNYIYIKLDETNTYLVLAHLKKASITVKVGDHVKTGDVIGHVGNSGTSSEPHLHIQHQRQNPLHMKIAFLAEGLPLYFKINGDSVMPKHNEVITPNK